MKRLFTAFFACSSLLLRSQTPIVIASSDMPAANDTLRMSFAPVQGVVYNLTGANYTWNYSSLKADRQELRSYKNSLQSPYLIQFFNKVGCKVADNMNFGVIAVENVWNFYSGNSSVYRLDGMGFTYQGLPSGVVFTDADEQYLFPLEYGDTSVRTFKGKVSYPGLGELIVSGTRSNTVDGWGEITTPFGAFKCIRVKSVIRETDTLIVTQLGNIKIPQPNNRTEYKWLAKGIRIPVLEIVVTDGLFGNPTVSEVKYRDKYRIPKPTADFFALDIMPEKGVTEVVFSDMSTDAARWKWVVQPAGGVVYMQGTNDSSQNPVIKFMNSGSYTVRLTVSNESGTATANKQNYITAGTAPVVRFAAGKLSLSTSDSVLIRDSSLNVPDYWYWDIEPKTFTFLANTNESSKIIRVRFYNPGYYSVTLNAGNYWGMNSLSKNNYILVTGKGAGIEKQQQSALTVFPNPVKDFLKVDLDKVYPHIFVSVLSIDGRLISSKEFGNTNQVEMNASELSSGVYILMIEAEGNRYPVKFVIE